MESLEVAIRAVGDEHQACENEEVCDDARSAVRDERQGNARQWDDSKNSADDDECLEREAERQAGREELREAVAREERDPEAAQDEDHVEEEQPCGADQAELLCERRVDEVGVEIRDDLMPGGRAEGATAEAGPAHRPVRNGVERLHLLVALA